MSQAAEVEEGVLTTLGGALAEAGAASLAGPREQLGEGLLRAALTMWEDPQVRPKLLGVLREATTSDEGAAQMRTFMSTQLFAQAGQALGEAPMDINQVAQTLNVPPINLYAAAAQVWGVVLLRYVLELEPLASATAEELVALLSPTIQRYLLG
jgi:Tetracyclin repressor-like, C-terminal domain